MPHATASPVRGAWIRPHARPAPPSKPVDPIASNISLLQYLAGTAPRHRSTSPIKRVAEERGGNGNGKGQRKETPGPTHAKVKLPKGLGLEGLEGLQYRPPPPPASLPPVAVVEVVDEEGTDYGDEDGEGGDEVVEIVHRKSSPGRMDKGSRGERTTRYHDSNASVQERRSYYRPPPPPSQVQQKPTTTPAARRDPVRCATAAAGGPIAHVSTMRHLALEPMGAASARAALERGIRERKLERFGREERGWGMGREEREVGYAAHHRVGDREVARMGSGSRAMREAITPLVM